MDSPVVKTSWLAEHLGEEDLRVLDCTVEVALAEGSTGMGVAEIRGSRAEYERAHIPGASFVDLTTELSDPVAIYDGSLSEWTSDPSLPLETG